MTHKESSLGPLTGTSMPLLQIGYQLSCRQVAPSDIVEHNRISLSKCDTQASPDGASTSQLVSRFVKYLLRMMVHEEYMRTVEQCFTAL
ncbi:hypothetical protein DPX16_20749 [Anabarilius grahami]|uniref:Uncharacterized protein n=1 Tax=Anabarilius grahami TaxID=495550 RepID=A0A3N0YF65_ANAGA|nr:hypothetical protein DPX16_20749 [Anabarilius grahami]